MSGDLLRRAAERLRAGANGATDGPWVADVTEIYSQFHGGPWVGETLQIDDHVQGATNAEYIALMGPPVALAVADWLDFTATLIETLRPALGVYFSRLERLYGPSLAVARAVLRDSGEDS